MANNLFLIMGSNVCIGFVWASTNSIVLGTFLKMLCLRSEFFLYSHSKNVSQSSLRNAYTEAFLDLSDLFFRRLKYCD